MIISSCLMVLNVDSGLWKWVPRLILTTSKRTESNCGLKLCTITDKDWNGGYRKTVKRS